MGWLRQMASRARTGPQTGGDAIVAHISAATGACDPFTFGFGDMDVIAYRVQDPLPHILYVTLGLSRTRSAVPVAGTQTELTLRVPAVAPLPYAWPAEQLAAMARQVRSSGNEIAPGHYLRLGTPLPGAAKISGFTFVTDPVLGIIDPPTGIVRFTYAVGVTAPELEAALAWDPLKFTGVLGDAVALGLTDPQRADVMGDPRVRARVEGGAAREGSSISAELARCLSTSPSGRIDMDPRAARALLRAARYRARFGKPFALVSDDAWLRLGPGTQFEADDAHVQLPATPELVNELLATFDDAPGTYPLRSAPAVIHVVDMER